MKKINQAGMSSILFAMVFVIILSLLAVGFATLVRTDQQQVLDKTLSYQAQYAAESAINRKGAELVAINATGAVPADSAAGCGTTLNLNDASFSTEAEVTCITWKSTADTIVKDGLGTDPYISKLKTAAGGSSRITITWKSVNAGTTSGYTGSPTSLPTVDSNLIPIMRIAVAQSNLSGLQRMYFVPANGNAGAAGDGEVIATDCDAAGECSVSFNYNTDGSWLSMMVYGGLANVTVKASSIATGAALPLVGTQAIIDANARAQEVTKRVQARISLVPQTWNPGFALSTNGACKDFKVDGAQDESASGAAAPCF